MCLAAAANAAAKKNNMKTYEMCLSAVLTNGDTFRYVPDEFKTLRIMSDQILLTL